MSHSSGPLASPLRVAVVEVPYDCVLPTGFDDIPNLRFAFVAAERSPQGYQWYELHVDASHGIAAASASARQVMRRLHAHMEAQGRHDLRIVDGSLHAAPSSGERFDQPRVSIAPSAQPRH